MNFLERLTNEIVAQVFARLPQNQPSAASLKAAKLIAHRGVHEGQLAIENTLQAFELALNHRLWGIEFDVHLTRDNVAVVSHDPSPLRVFGVDIDIHNSTFSELRRAVPQIPTLQEVVSRFGRRLHLMIEIKEDLRAEKARAEQILNPLRELAPSTDFHLISLKPEWLEVFAPALPKSALVDVMWLNPREIFRLNSLLNHGGLAGHFLFISDSQIQTLHQEKKLVGVGFPDSKNSLFRELNRGVDWIFTNHPLSLRKHLPDST